MTFQEPPPPGAVAFLVNGSPLPPPTATVSLAEEDQHVVVFVTKDPTASLVAGTVCQVMVDDAPITSFTLDAPVAVDVLLMRQGADARLRLLRFLVATCSPILDLGLRRDFVALCHGIAWSAAAEATVEPLCKPSPILSVWRVPSAPAGSWHLIGQDRMRRIELPMHNLLLLRGRLPATNVLLLPPGIGAAPLPFAPVPANAPTARELVQKAIAVKADVPPRLASVLAMRARTDQALAALLRETQLLSPAKPKSLTDPAGPIGGSIEIALADLGGGIFLSGWLRDPLGLVSGLEIHSPFAASAVPAESLHRFGRSDLAESSAGTAFGPTGPNPGFAAHLPDADHPAVAQWRLALRLHSGENAGA